MPHYEVRLVGKLLVDAKSPDEAIKEVLNMPELDLELHLILEVKTPLSAIYKSLKKASIHRGVDEVKWDTKMIAAIVGVGRQTVIKWLHDGRYFNPAEVTKIGKKYLVSRHEVERVLTTHMDLKRMEASSLLN
jgi:hypothetical protein